MCHVPALDWLHMLYADELAYHSAVYGFAHGSEIRAIAQHVTNGHDAAVFVCLGCNVGAFLLSLGNRFLKKDVVAHFQGFHARFVVQVVRSGYHHRVRKFWNFEDFTPVPESPFRRNAEAVAHSILAALAYVGNTHNLHAVRVVCGVAGICPAAIARADDNYLDGFFDLCFQSFEREVQFICRHRCGFECFFCAENCCACGQNAETFQEIFPVHNIGC